MRKITTKQFQFRFLGLIFIAGVIPPAIGNFFLSYLDLSSALNADLGMSTLQFRAYALGQLIFVLSYFYLLFARPIARFIDSPDAISQKRTEDLIHRFPIDFWLIFVTARLLGPVVFFTSLSSITSFVPTGEEWVRIYLLSITVVIIVSLPIFFLILDGFGRLAPLLSFNRALVTIKTKVFLIGSLIPLMIDTLLVLYFSGRTGYFNSETIAVWLMLEVFAVAGTLLFIKSFNQSLKPLKSISAPHSLLDSELQLHLEALQPQSNDELGIIAREYAQLESFQHDAEMRLKRSEFELRTILDNMTDIFYQTDANGLIIRISKSVEKQLGYTVDEVIGTSMAAHYSHPEQREQFIQKLRANNGHISNFVAAIKHKDGRELMFSTSAHFSYDQEGNISGVEGTSRDVTQLYRAQQSLREEKQRATITLEGIGDGVVTVDNDGIIIFSNPVAHQLSVFKEEQLNGVLFDVAFPIADEGGEESLSELIHAQFDATDDTTLDEKGILHHADGSEFIINITASKLTNAEGETLGFVYVLRDVTESVLMHSQLNYQATHDTLTGLINRGEFELRLIQTIHESKEHKTINALLYIDLDQFKVVNDTCGHQVGDELLQQLTSIMSQAGRESDTLARLGGDEFGLILTHCPIEKAYKIGESLRKKIKDFRFMWENKSFEVGASIGLVPITEDSQNSQELMRAADSACYLAKESGRNRIYIYQDDDESLQKQHGEMNWIHRITKAIEDDQFVLFAQEIRALEPTDDKKPHYEALIRLKDDNGEIIPPMAFIPAAERYSLMPTVDRWVVKSAFKALSAQIGEDGSSPITLSINLSGQSLGDPNFLGFINKQLTKYKLPPRSICFEVTETAAITNLTDAMNLFDELKQRGCSFSLDDFG
ncbi:MAG: diguanylate cyclase, partial [Gammaproteobacteria bacterium]|nr:diguanylate cyclase [Gammaproteobacteria bacterium]